MVETADTMVPIGIDLAGSCKSPDILDPAIRPRSLSTIYMGFCTCYRRKHNRENLSKIVHFAFSYRIVRVHIAFKGGEGKTSVANVRHWTSSDHTNSGKADGNHKSD